MKKLLLLLLITPVFGFGQTEKGKWKLSGDTNISFMSLNGEVSYNDGFDNEESSTTSFTIEPSASYFVADDISIGFGISYSSTKNDYDDGIDGSSEAESQTLLIGPQASYYFKGTSTRPYFGLGFGLSSTNNGDDSNKYNGVYFGFEGGVSIFINNNVSFDLGLNYANTNLKNKSDSEIELSTNGIGFLTGFSIYFN